jgi:hypothetical protein
MVDLCTIGPKYSNTKLEHSHMFHAVIGYLHIIVVLKPSAVVHVFKIIYMYAPCVYLSL